MVKGIVFLVEVMHALSAGIADVNQMVQVGKELGGIRVERNLVNERFISRVKAILNKEQVNKLEKIRAKIHKKRMDKLKKAKQE